jgi:flagellar basal-body rod modification protein FlgD
MSTLSLDPLTAAAEAAAAQGSPPARTLGREEFLRLLVAQLENQDPLHPLTDTEFVAQLATFSSLEQLISVNDNLQSLAFGQGQLVNAQALGLIGKEALVEAGGGLRIKDGKPDTLVYAIPRQAQQATLTLVDSAGATVRTLELETTPNGRVTLAWDGTDEEGKPLPDGDYSIKISATALDGEPMSIALFRSLRIDGVSFAGGEIALVSGDREIPFEKILEIRAGEV